MNQLINRYLEEMEFFCQFEINESFEETIKSRFRDSFSYASFSEGEKMRIDLALLFTWREMARMRNASPINLLILDEIMDSSLDSNGTEEFINIVSRLTGDNNIVIISHKHEQIIDKFDKVLKIEKHKNFSRIKQ
jgi:DNA repair exonuclease SbcCD ATPase subunit